jgi:hypothetical protein
MEDSITVHKPNRNCSTNGSSSGDRLSQTQSKSDALKFKSITPAVAIGSRSIYIRGPQMGNYRYEKTNMKYIIDPSSDSNKQLQSTGKRPLSTNNSRTDEPKRINTSNSINILNSEEHLDQNTPHVEAPVDQADNIIESENDDDLDDDNLTNRELYNLLLKIYWKTTKKQERKIKELETKIDNLREYIMSLPNQSNNNINRKKSDADAVIGHQTINTNVNGQRTEQRHTIKPNTDIKPITKPKDILLLLEIAMKQTLHRHQ